METSSDSDTPTDDKGVYQSFGTGIQNFVKCNEGYPTTQTGNNGNASSLNRSKCRSLSSSLDRSSTISKFQFSEVGEDDKSHIHSMNQRKRSASISHYLNRSQSPASWGGGSEAVKVESCET